MDKKKHAQLYWEMVYTDDETAVQKRMVVDPEKVTIINKKQAEAYAKKMFNERERIKDTRGHYVVTKNKAYQTLEESDLTLVDRAYMMQLLLYAQFDGKPLSTEDGELITIKKLCELWNIARFNVNRHIKKFLDAGILIKKQSPTNKRSNEFYLNPEFFVMGKYNSKERFVKVFKNKLKEVIDNLKAIEAEENKKSSATRRNVKVVDLVGVLNAVMPYFHYQTYYLVENQNENLLEEYPDILTALEDNPKALKHLTKVKISNILGHERMRTKTIDEYMDYLQRAGAIIILKSSNRKRYIVHPDLLFRSSGLGEDTYTRNIRVLFAQHKK